jgi:23S rRNA (cytosine1962-C5)-methyltransferase
VNDFPPCVLFEDEHLLVVNKPAGMNTHAPAPFAGEGIYDWLRHREPRWASLAIIHRLDKETSGVLVFGKTPLANRSLTEQFATRSVRKRYVLLTDRPVNSAEFTVTSALVRAGEKYLSRPLHAGAERAETEFRLIKTSSASPRTVEARPVTGRTHQIRAQAAASGFPILGDELYGGTSAARLCLHAQSLALHHPVSGAALEFTVPGDFGADVQSALRAAVIDPGTTNALRLLHGAADNWPGFYLDRFGDFLLAQSEGTPSPAAVQQLESWRLRLGLRGVYHKRLTRQVGAATVAESSPQHICGEATPKAFFMRENGVRFELSFDEGYSVGLFLDQRENRRRVLVNHVAAGFPMFAGGLAGREVMNTFAYTCGFSVCAALAGAKTTSLDLSKKYLEWGRRNFAHNGIDPAAHDFIYGDTFDWFRRLARKGRGFDAVLLDPPTFSRSKDQGVFQADKDFGRLVAAAIPVLKSGGVLFAATNATTLHPEIFLETIKAAIETSGRRIARQHYVPQPTDFPMSRAEPAYLKTVWLQLE